ncbi:MAG: hypothetical protein LBN07_02140 [Christensenellaceae bacterium]|nr:hypothetical protein [Christensenellaceae bacterium]
MPDKAFRLEYTKMPIVRTRGIIKGIITNFNIAIKISPTLGPEGTPYKLTPYSA